MPDLDEILAAEIAARDESGLRRRLREPLEPTTPTCLRSRLSLGSNDYLGLSRHPDVIAAAANAAAIYGTGATGSRLTSGNLKVHQDLEAALARLKETEAALLFPTGYQAAIGTIPALTCEGDLIVSDVLNHASLIDGCRLSRATVRTYAHNDLADLSLRLGDRRAYRRCLVVTEGVFSMDGDVAPLAEIDSLCRANDAWLMVDDAHGTGVLGEGGRGTCQMLGVKPQVQMGTLSKALGSAGGFICGSSILIDHLINAARSFIYTTGPTPASSASALAAIDVIAREPNRIDRLTKISQKLRQGIRGIGLDVPEGITPIIPVMIGGATDAVSFAAHLNADYGVVAIRPPTVPAGSSRLRVTATALIDEGDIEDIVADFEKAARSSRFGR